MAVATKKPGLIGLRRTLLALMMLLPMTLWAATESSWPMDPFEPDLHNQPSLQSGASTYINYCVGCHSLKFQRYARTAQDLGIPEDLASELLIHTGQKIGDHIKTAMPAEKAKAWFGGPPPDLTMVARTRGGEWLYNYLRAFYLDEQRPLGVNNKVFANVGMPHVMLDLQGIVRKGCAQVPLIAPNGGERRDELVPGKTITTEDCDQLILEEGSGKQSPEEFDQTIYDLVNFLTYVGEPYALERQRIGVYVLLFLLIMFGFAYLLNREYWKDVKH